MTKADNTITQLYGDFERAYADQEQALGTCERASEGSHKAEEEHWSRALGRCNKIAERILEAPSQNRDEMLLKIRVAGWRAGVASPPSAMDKWKPTRRRYPGEEFHAYLALATLRDDIRRLDKHRPTAGAKRRPALATTFDKRVSCG